MPLVTVSARKGRTQKEKNALLDAIHEALVEAFRVPVCDRKQRYCEFDEADFEIQPGRTPQFTIVELTVFPGRSPEAKRALYQAIVRRFGDQGIDPMDVLIVLYEPPIENWGIRGGVPASDVDLGFKVDV
jgi:phenylpyruvate tautomerase PptA (4-oxalocrotonate tautomerase family)